MAAGATGRRRALLVVTGALAVVAGLVWGWMDTSGERDPGDRPPAPTLSLTALDGQPLQLRDFRGHVVLIDFWATWCGPCQDEVPELVALQKAYAPRGVQFLGVSMDDDEAVVRAFYQEMDMNYPVALGDAELAERYGGVLGLPVKFLIDREGRIAARHDGPTEAAALARELSALLAE